MYQVTNFKINTDKEMVQILGNKENKIQGHQTGTETYTLHKKSFYFILQFEWRNKGEF